MTKGHRVDTSSLNIEQMEALYSEPIICNTAADLEVLRYEISELKAVVAELTRTQSEVAMIKGRAQRALGQRLHVLRQINTNHT